MEVPQLWVSSSANEDTSSMQVASYGVAQQSVLTLC